jgi:hypothetical protein
MAVSAAIERPWKYRLLIFAVVSTPNRSVATLAEGIK